MLRCLLRHPIIAKGQRCTAHTDLTCLVRFCYLMILFIQPKRHAHSEMPFRQGRPLNNHGSCQFCGMYSYNVISVGPYKLIKSASGRWSIQAFRCFGGITSPLNNTFRTFCRHFIIQSMKNTDQTKRRYRPDHHRHFMVTEIIQQRCRLMKTAASAQ